MCTDEHERRFRQLLAEHTGLLLKVVRSFTKGGADADHLFQEIVLQVWLSLPTFREESRPTSWLDRVALNTAMSWKRGERRRPTHQEGGSIADTFAARPSPAPGRNGEVVERLYAAIRTLPPAKRAIVVLHLDGFSYREIAEMIGISASNVGVRLSRIRQELAAVVVKEVGDES